MPLVATQPAKEVYIVVLRKVGSDTHMIFTSDVDDVVEDLDTLVDGGLVTPRQEGRSGRVPFVHRYCCVCPGGGARNAPYNSAPSKN